MNYLYPSGVNIEEIIENIATVKSKQYKKIAYLDEDDIKQEVRIKCYDSLEKYNFGRSEKIHTFLSICADNKIKDIKRSLVYKHSLPCHKCPFWDKDSAQSGMYDCVAFNRKEYCDKFKKHSIFVKNKISANMALDVDEEIIYDKKNVFDSIELYDYIESSLPSSLMFSYNKFKNSNFSSNSLSSKERSILFPILQSIMSEMKDEKNE